jgi:hypothetical protein
VPTAAGFSARFHVLAGLMLHLIGDLAGAYEILSEGRRRAGDDAELLLALGAVIETAAALRTYELPEAGSRPRGSRDEPRFVIEGEEGAGGRLPRTDLADAQLHIVGTESVPVHSASPGAPSLRSEMLRAHGSWSNAEKAESGYVYLLRRAAETTGGTYSAVESTAALPATFRKILEASAARYVLRYEPTRVPRAGRHRLKVSVRRRGVDVRARQEYVAAGAPADEAAIRIADPGPPAFAGTPPRAGRRTPGPLPASRGRTASLSFASTSRVVRSKATRSMIRARRRAKLRERQSELYFEV